MTSEYFNSMIDTIVELLEDKIKHDDKIIDIINRAERVELLTHVEAQDLRKYSTKYREVN